MCVKLAGVAGTAGTPATPAALTNRIRAGTPAVLTGRISCISFYFDCTNQPKNIIPALLVILKLKLHYVEIHCL